VPILPAKFLEMSKEQNAGKLFGKVDAQELEFSMTKIEITVSNSIRSTYTLGKSNYRLRYCIRAVTM